MPVDFSEANDGLYKEALGGRPAKGFLRNLDNGRQQQFLFNPAEFTETYEAQYARKGSLGLSHERMQFLGNKNAKIPLKLLYDEYFIKLGYLSGRSVGSQIVNVRQDPEATSSVRANTGVSEVKRFFLESIYPRRSQKLFTASPTALLFVWPNEISMRVRITKLSFRHVMFQSKTARPRIMIVSVDLEEDVQDRIYSGDVADYGTQRPWATSDNSRRRGF